MSFNDIDLDINNYDLKDIISLFQIPYDFTKSDLRNAKRIVLAMHPDKSKLDKEYFLFFTSAYKLLFSIYEFRNKSQDQVFDPNKVYVAEKDIYKEEILKTINKKYNDSKSFNRWFNDLFEKTKIKDEENDNGYEEWFRNDSQCDCDNDTQESISQTKMHENFDKKKAEARAKKSLIIAPDIINANSIGSSNGAFDLGRTKVEDYSSDIFGKLTYNDLKIAHTETLIPVTEEDFLNKKRFNNVNEIQIHRSTQDTKPLSLDKANSFLNTTREKEAKIDIERAYKLAKQDELVNKANDTWWSSIRKLTMNN
jgi:hypothetical protein